jgi:hypothetical protein
MKKKRDIKKKGLKWKKKRYIYKNHIYSLINFTFSPYFYKLHFTS